MLSATRRVGARGCTHTGDLAFMVFISLLPRSVTRCRLAAMPTPLQCRRFDAGLVGGVSRRLRDGALSAAAFVCYLLRRALPTCVLPSPILACLLSYLICHLSYYLSCFLGYTFRACFLSSLYFTTFPMNRKNSKSTSTYHCLSWHS